MGIMELLGLRDSSDQPSVGANGEIGEIDEVVAALETLDKERAHYLAHVSFLLSRVAHADLDISAEERRRIETILIDAGGLNYQEAKMVAEIACSRTILQAGTADHRITRGFKELTTKQQRLSLLHCLFAVSAADKDISVDEDNEIRRISMELDLEHDDFIKARAPFRESLAVLK